MNYETTYHRIKYIYEILGNTLDVDDARVLVVLKTDTNNAETMASTQSYNEIDFIYQEDLSESNLNNYRFITFLDNENYYYEENYIEELISGFKYADIDFVTKDNSQEKFNFTNTFSDIYLTMFDLTALNKIDIESIKKESLSGLNIDNTEVLLNSELPSKREKAPKLSVVVPIHNNGKYLENKCLRSLKRQSIFDDMEVIFVNDGSTDSETINIINRLIRRNPDIKYFEFEEASGSASTPRNKGVEIATTNYVTFLDPDNEATGDGFTKLFNEIEADESLDMVVGNMVKEDQNEKVSLTTIRQYNTIISKVI